MGGDNVEVSNGEISCFGDSEQNYPVEESSSVVKSVFHVGNFGGEVEPTRLEPGAVVRDAGEDVQLYCPHGCPMAWRDR